MTKLEEVREKVIEAVPDIVKEQFGCKVRILSNSVMGDEVFRKYGERLYWLGGDSTKWYCSHAWIEWKMMEVLKRKGSVEIIGRPITLADVLRAIDKALGFGCVMLVHSDGLMIWSDPEVATERITWNLALSLDDQEPPVIEFLHKILCV